MHNTNPLIVCPNYNPAPLHLNPLPSGGQPPYSYQWYENDMPVGNDLPRYDPQNLTNPGVFWYYCQVTDECSHSESTVAKIITVVDEASVSISGGGTRCQNSVITLTSELTGGTGTFTYQWQSSANNTPPWDNIPNATNNTYNPLSGIPGRTYYRVQVTVSGAACNNTYSNSLYVDIIPLPSAVIRGDTLLCSEVNAPLTIDVTGSAPWNITYTDGTTPVIISNILDTPYILNVSPYSTTTYTILSVSDNTGCINYYNTLATITINEVYPGVIGSDQEICPSDDTDTITEISPASGSGYLSYQWQSSTTSCLSGFSDIIGANNNTFDPGSIVTVPTFYRRIVTSTTGSCLCTAASNCISINIIDPTPPTISCPISIFLYYTDSGRCLSTQSFSVTATDNCSDPYIEYLTNTTPITFPFEFPVGSTIVTARATNNHSLVSECSFNVIVRDNQPPVITCISSPQIRNPDSGLDSYTAVGSEFDYTDLRDNCGTATATHNLIHTSNTTLEGYIFGLGDTEVIWTAIDESGNEAYCSFIVTVISPGLEVEKSVDQTTIDAPTTLIYTITITNTGNTSLTGVTLTDEFASTEPVMVSGDETNPGVLDVGEVWLASATYVVTQADIDAGTDLVNVAVVDSDQTEPQQTEAVTSIINSSSITITKVADEDNFASVDDEINYTIVVTNTGNIILTDVLVTDPLTRLSRTISTLQPGVSNAAEIETTYTVTLDDINDGLVNNTVTARFSYNGINYLESDSESVPALQAPELTISKTAAQDDYSAVGEEISYNIIVSNTGNVTLTNISITDPLTGLNQIISSLDPGESETLITSYRVTQNDFNTGHINNTATARYTFRGVTNTVSDSESVAANQIAGWTLTKTSEETSFDEVDDIIHYNINITNTGNVTISNVLVSDPGADPGSIRYISGDINRNNRLDPDEIWRYTATYTVTQADIDAGQYINTATVNGNTPSGTIDPAEDTDVVLSIQIPELTVTKSTTITSYIATGEVIDYEITVINTGNVTISGVEVTDPNAEITCAGAPYTLAQGSSIACTAIHTVSPEDIDEASITNSATASGYAPNSDAVTGVSNIVIVPLNNLPPEISCPTPVITTTRETTCDILISEGLAATFSDPNDNIATLTWTMTGATIAESDDSGINNITSYTFNLGETVVNYTVTDALGLSASCSFTVTVSDITPPVAICRDITVELDINTGTATITPDDINNGSFDNCGIASMTIDRTDFDCTDLGPNNVTLTVIDNLVNVGSCTALVTFNYAVNPNPAVTPSENIICNGETIELVLTNNIPNTTWTWTVSATDEVTGASGDDSGELSSIIQTLTNSDNEAHNVVYTIMPQVYGQCDLTTVTAEVWVNPTPEINVSPETSTICYGESTIIVVDNPLGPIRGEWMYELTVVPDEGIAGYMISGIYTNTGDLIETLTNSTREIRKVEYIFIPRIVTGNGSTDCIGEPDTVTIWVHPEVDYTTEISDYKSYNISCYGYSNGFINIYPNPDAAPYTFIWTVPDGFTSSSGEISGLTAGEYTMIITDRNDCSVSETFELNQPDRLGMTIATSVSDDGNYNINCHAGTTGSITVEAVNNVGSAQYLWIDGFIGNERTGLNAGNYKIIIVDANYCTADSSVTLTDPETITLHFEVSQPYCDGTADGEVRLTVTGGIEDGGYSFLWSDGSNQQNLSNVRTGVYTVTVTDANGCTTVGSVPAGIIHKHCLIIPGAISPNGDLINDVWNIGNVDIYPEVIITIYNRWGQLLWKSEPGYPHPWDGRNNGRALPIDAYHYTIDIRNGYKLIIGIVTIVDI